MTQKHPLTGLVVLLLLGVLLCGRGGGHLWYLSHALTRIAVSTRPANVPATPVEPFRTAPFSPVSGTTAGTMRDDGTPGASPPAEWQSPASSPSTSALGEISVTLPEAEQARALATADRFETAFLSYNYREEPEAYEARVKAEVVGASWSYIVPLLPTYTEQTRATYRHWEYRCVATVKSHALVVSTASRALVRLQVERRIRMALFSPLESATAGQRVDRVQERSIYVIVRTDGTTWQFLRFWHGEQWL